MNDSGITVKPLAASVSSASGIALHTFEVEFPRIILAEGNTHRVISKNTSSTRAIRIESAIGQLRLKHFVPNFTKKQPGMMANELVDPEVQAEAEEIWEEVMEAVILGSQKLDKLGVSKQYAGRILEPFQYVKCVWTATDWRNFLRLRNHPAAQPEIRVLAQMIEEKLATTPLKILNPGEWHTPYFGDGFWTPDCGVPLDTALKIAASCCAQVSYRTLDDSEEKALRVIERLIPGGDEPVHSSPFENCATPMDYESAELGLETEGVTTTNGEDFFSGNLRGWIQYRQLIPNNAVYG